MISSMERPLNGCRSAMLYAVLALVWLAIGCGDDETEFQIPQTSSSPITETDAGPQRVAECDGAPSGTVCGQPGKHMHCIFDACIKNACGDGVKAEQEECDDGNERAFDGCDARCKVEPDPGCGNGVLEAGEQCDDSNTSDEDQCTSRCTIPACGDGIKSLGEACDDGNLSDADSCDSRCRISTASETAPGSAGHAGNGGSQAGSGGRGGSNAGVGGA